MPISSPAMLTCCSTSFPRQQIKAEEEFGYGGFRYIGGGKYVAAPGQTQNEGPPSYGAV